MNSYTNEAGRVEFNYNNILTCKAWDTYRDFNPEKFDEVHCFNAFRKCVDLIATAHDQIITLMCDPNPEYRKTSNNNSVLLACSGGLDSIYQSFWLRDHGYNVILFHCANMNFYTNGQELKTVESFAKKHEFPLVVVRQVSNFNKDNHYKKFWQENSWKDMLFYSMMCDHCIEHDIHYISSGDDLRLNLSDAVVGTNLSDAHEITEAFLDGLKEITNIKFIPVNRLDHKGIRLQKIIENNALDDFYSCVNPGKFNQSNHKRIEEKFNVKLEKNNCGVCRKCAFHTLLRHYYLKEHYPDEFINFCWDKISIGADNVFFNKDLPLETRIKNLYDY